MSQSDFVIEQNNLTGRVTYWNQGANQSMADANGVSLADYIHAMYFYIRKARARRVLMIGCGGGTLATMLIRAGVEVTVVDLDPNAFEIAHRYFAMPEEALCHVADGAAFLARTRARFDAIVLDAYDGDRIPAQLATPRFFALARSRMTARNSLFLMNVIVANDDDRTPDRLARAALKSFRQVRLLDCDGWVDRNAVLLAGAVAGLPRPRLLLRPARGARKIARDLRDLVFRPLRD